MSNEVNENEEEFLAELQRVEDLLEAAAAEKAAKAVREKELRMIKKREAMEALITKLEGEESPTETMQGELVNMLSPMTEKSQKTNVFRMLTRTLQSSMRQLRVKLNGQKIPSDVTNKQEWRLTFAAMQCVCGLLLLELSQIDPEGAGEYNSNLIERMRTLKTECEGEKSRCVEAVKEHILLVESRISFFIDVMTTLENEGFLQHAEPISKYAPQRHGKAVSKESHLHPPTIQDLLLRTMKIQIK
jgi:hypothetical protein